jgi:hypothetical protein
VSELTRQRGGRTTVQERLPTAADLREDDAVAEPQVEETFRLIVDEGAGGCRAGSGRFWPPGSSAGSTSAPVSWPCCSSNLVGGVGLVTLLRQLRVIDAVRKERQSPAINVPGATRGRCDERR